IAVNLVNTDRSYLCNFAQSHYGNRQDWQSPCSGDYAARKFMHGQSFGQTNEQNIQLIYNFNVSDYKALAEIYPDFMKDVSYRIQRSFNARSLEDRHLIKNKNEFPWKQFHNYYDI
ncbi:MAG: hypothetical protein AAF126_18230, partial [Chloroflexota bacterium]